jgi:hypothetical protein
MTLTLANFAELLIMWFVPNLFFGWKVGGGGKLETFEKLSGQYVSPILEVEIHSWAQLSGWAS